ncbi:MAG: hypothetical protein U1F43_15810 [Myxococcota bacterium]
MTTLGCLAGGGTARADKIPGPPETCPPGATPESCHGGPYCAVTECDPSTPCPAGMGCQPVEGCFRRLNCAGDVNPEDLPRYVRWSFDAPCDAARSCCSTRSICVAAAPPARSATPATATAAPSAPTRSACAGGGADLGLFLASAALALRRFRSRT